MSVDDVIKSGLLNVIGLFSRDVIGWKTRVEFVNSHWSSYYAHLDDRANDLRTTTSVTQLLSDEYDNNSGSTTAAKTLVSFRPDFDLGPR